MTKYRYIKKDSIKNIEDSEDYNTDKDFKAVYMEYDNIGGKWIEDTVFFNGDLKKKIESFELVDKFKTKCYKTKK